MDYDDYEANEFLQERRFQRQRTRHQIEHYDPRDPDYIDDEDSEDE